MIYAFIAEHDEYAAARRAEFFGVSRSGYYAYLERRERRESEKEKYKSEIRQIFNERGGTYGPDRICGILRKQGHKASYGKVSKLMAEMGLSSVHNRHKNRSFTNSKKSRGEGFPNLVRNQKFDRPRKAVCSDITYLWSDEGWLYLCTVKDIVTKEILGEATGERLTKDLAIRAFLNAQARHSLAAGTIFHSDRGSQYASGNFKATLDLYGMKQSFSRVGMPGDNSWAESFFATLKKECIHFERFATRDELRETAFAWINGFYNARRVQAGLGYIAPKVYAALLMIEGLAA